ncbi:hypothetical protein Gotri_013531 [Gossypium trilobum]|uniref:NADP-dependent oxidoreductase domain-containing protein n=1 Tax=Gossypium trilobum TaxID=34281 RepID=A0A7J9DTT6_9ROSI|nr:hypothetical protein [Gossypium trilobum]
MYSSKLALAWVLHQGDDVAPIPVSCISRIKDPCRITSGYSCPYMSWTQIKKNLDSNIESLKVKLTEEDLKEISEISPINEVAGATLSENLMQFTWEYTNTPPKNNAKV